MSVSTVFANLSIASRASAIYQASHPHRAKGEPTDWKAIGEALFQAIDEHETPKNVDMLLAAAVPSCYGGGLEVSEEVALAWLERTHGVRPGDVIMANGWAKPREILVERLRMSTGSSGTWWLWFDGPCRTPKGPERRTSGTFAYESLWKVPGPSNSLARFMAAEKQQAPALA